MKTTLTAALVTVVTLTLALSSTGCSSSETKDPGPGTAGTATTPAPTTTVPDDGTPPPDTTPATTALKAPTLDGIMKMHGALHVSWTNEDTTCTAVELERKTATVAWKMVYSLPGEADNKHDANATDATMYTYRVRCKKGTDYSPYSNEKSATP